MSNAGDGLLRSDRRLRPSGVESRTVDGSCHTGGMARPTHEWTVAGAVLEHGDGLLLVCNQRRNGSLDWSTPGGVIDATDASVSRV